MTADSPTPLEHLLSLKAAVHKVEDEGGTLTIDGLEFVSLRELVEARVRIDELEVALRQLRAERDRLRSELERLQAAAKRVCACDADPGYLDAHQLRVALGFLRGALRPVMPKPKSNTTDSPDGARRELPPSYDPGTRRVSSGEPPAPPPAAPRAADAPERACGDCRHFDPAAPRCVEFSRSDIRSWFLACPAFVPANTKPPQAAPRAADEPERTYADRHSPSTTCTGCRWLNALSVCAHPSKGNLPAPASFPLCHFRSKPAGCTRPPASRLPAEADSPPAAAAEPDSWLDRPAHLRAYSALDRSVQLDPPNARFPGAQSPHPMHGRAVHACTGPSAPLTSVQVDDDPGDLADLDSSTERLRSPSAPATCSEKQVQQAPRRSSRPTEGMAMKDEELSSDSGSGPTSSSSRCRDADSGARVFSGAPERFGKTGCENGAKTAPPVPDSEAASDRIEEASGDGTPEAPDEAIGEAQTDAEARQQASKEQANALEQPVTTPVEPTGAGLTSLPLGKLEPEPSAPRSLSLRDLGPIVLDVFDNALWCNDHGYRPSVEKALSGLADRYGCACTEAAVLPLLQADLRRACELVGAAEARRDEANADFLERLRSGSTRLREQNDKLLASLTPREREVLKQRFPKAEQPPLASTAAPSGSLPLSILGPMLHNLVDCTCYDLEERGEQFSWTSSVLRELADAYGCEPERPQLEPRVLADLKRATERLELREAERDCTTTTNMLKWSEALGKSAAELRRACELLEDRAKLERHIERLEHMARRLERHIERLEQMARRLDAARADQAATPDARSDVWRMLLELGAQHGDAEQFLTIDERWTAIVNRGPTPTPLEEELGVSPGSAVIYDRGQRVAFLSSTSCGLLSSTSCGLLGRPEHWATEYADWLRDLELALKTALEDAKGSSS